MQALNSQLKPIIHNNNALNNSMETSVQWFKSVEERWKLDSYKSGRLLVCDEICGKCKSK